MMCTLGLAAQEAIIDTTKMYYRPLLVPVPYYRVNYTYQSVAPDGITPVTLSSALFFPQKIFERTRTVHIGGKEYNASGLVLNNHYTITTRGEAPTLTDAPMVEGPFVALGPNVITVSPDGYGFGTTDDKPQSYLMADVTARNNIDAVGAARRLLKEMGYTCGDLFAQLGYSQGGHTTMAVQRYFDTHDIDPEVISHIDYTICGDGPYDIVAMVDSLLQPGSRYTFPCALPLIVIGQIEGAALDISYSDLFPAPLDTKMPEWINSKEIESTVLNDSIFAYTGGGPFTGTLVSNILRTDNFTRSNPTMEPLFQALADNSLVSGWKPNSKTRFYLYHSFSDEVVPYYCMEIMRDFLRDECGIDDDRLETFTTTGSHIVAAALFVVNAINRINRLEIEYMTDTYIETPAGDYNDAAPSSPDGWYNIHGQRLTGASGTPGIYFHNGRKVLIR